MAANEEDMVEKRRLSTSMQILNKNNNTTNTSNTSDFSNEYISSSYSRDSSINQPSGVESDHSGKIIPRKQKTFDEFELDSRRELIANSVGTGSENSASNFLAQSENKSNDDNQVSSKQKKMSTTSMINSGKVKKSPKKLLENQDNSLSLEPNLKKDPGASVFDASILMDYDDLDESDGLVNGVGRGGVGVGENPNQKTTTLGLTKPPNNLDATTRGGLSTTYNAQIADDSLSTLSDKKKRVIVRIVTIFSVIFFLICFAMIAFTLRMSEKIDAQIRKSGYSGGSNFNALAISTKSSILLLNSSGSTQTSSNLTTTRKIDTPLMRVQSNNNKINQSIPKLRNRRFLENLLPLKNSELSKFLGTVKTKRK